ncbi:MAG TPA: response regulator transcription factor [Bacteroidia bacterium]|jgi:DNA-binding response OmpR family regulator|nr:response regulator transcription factor [Bacteroidia bacterium]
MKILIVEDEPKLAQFIEKGLKEQNYQVDVAFDGETGKKLALHRNYDCIILDLILPQIGGLEVCKGIREENSAVPIIMLTALGSTEDKVTGLDSGADDYLTKPFKLNELLARIRALARRKNKPVDEVRLALSNLTLDSSTKSAQRDGKSIVLTSREYFLLEFLLKNQGRVVTRAEIAQNVWDISFDSGTNVVDVYVNYLRNKVDKGFSPKLIHTVFGMGYIMKEE